MVKPRKRRKKPKFRRQDWHSLKRLKKKKKGKWRKPRGSQSKLRKGKKGHPAKPRIGYATPRKLRGLHPSGFREVLVHNLQELESVDVKQQAVRIASGVGKKKRAVLLERAKELKVKVLNPKS